VRQLQTSSDELRWAWRVVDRKVYVLYKVVPAGGGAAVAVWGENARYVLPESLPVELQSAVRDVLSDADAVRRQCDGVTKAAADAQRRQGVAQLHAERAARRMSPALRQLSEEATAGWLDDLMGDIDSGRVDAALGAGPLGDIVARECDNPNGVITRETLQCLVGDTWLNGRVIDAFFGRLEEKYAGVRRLGGHFFTKLAIEGPSPSLERWTQRWGSELPSRIIFPVNISSYHWGLVVVVAPPDECGDGTLTFYDSGLTKQFHTSAAATAKLRVVQNWLDKTKLFARWKGRWQLQVGECTQQEDGFSCGVFVCANALRAAAGWPCTKRLTFDQRRLPRFRRFIAHCILADDDDDRPAGDGGERGFDGDDDGCMPVAPAAATTFFWKVFF